MTMGAMMGGEDLLFWEGVATGALGAVIAMFLLMIWSACMLAGDCDREGKE